MRILPTLALALLGSVALAAAAQGDYPQQAIRLVVPFTPGGGTDAVARLIADKLMQTHKGWTVGAAPALQDLIGGQTDLMFATPQAVLGLIKGGKLRALAVTSAQRLPVLPDVPTVDESGYRGFEASDWKAIVAPAGTPTAVLMRLNAAVELALGQTATLARLLAHGSAPLKGSVDEVARYVESEHARWGSAVRAANVQVN